MPNTQVLFILDSENLNENQKVQGSGYGSLTS